MCIGRQALYSEQEEQILQIFTDLPEDADNDVDVTSDDEDTGGIRG